MSFAGSASCWKTTGFEALDHGLGVGRGGLGQACQCHNAGHGQHEGGGDAAGHDHACLALAPAEVVDEGLHMRLRRGACDLRLERQAGFEAGRVAEVVAVAGLGAHGEGEVLEKEAKLLVVRCERAQPCPERAGQRHGESFAPRMRLRFNLRIVPLMNFARNRRRTRRRGMRVGKWCTQRSETSLCLAGRGGTDHYLTPVTPPNGEPPGVTRPVSPSLK